MVASICVLVKVDKTTYTLNTAPTSTVAELVRAAAELTLVPAKKMLLTKAGAPLMNQTSAISDFGIESDTVLECKAPAGVKTAPPRCCPGTSYDNVRVFKGYMTFRCRTCEGKNRASGDRIKQWKCEQFWSRGGCERANCQQLHLHFRKQNLQERFNVHGEKVLDAVIKTNGADDPQVLALRESEALAAHQAPCSVHSAHEEQNASTLIVPLLAGGNVCEAACSARAHAPHNTGIASAVSSPRLTPESSEFDASEITHRSDSSQPRFYRHDPYNNVPSADKTVPVFEYPMLPSPVAHSSSHCTTPPRGSEATGESATLHGQQ
ncbi:hypothetical protein DIPPA_05508 [Diplonema papillatum]|nr:hypothetical protein DIPPA_05508 [Diplonema papillatum]